MMRRPGIIQTVGPLYALAAVALPVGATLAIGAPSPAVVVVAILLLALGLSSALLGLLHAFEDRR